MNRLVTNAYPVSVRVVRTVCKRFNIRWSYRRFETNRRSKFHFEFYSKNDPRKHIADAFAEKRNEKNA